MLKGTALLSLLVTAPIHAMQIAAQQAAQNAQTLDEAAAGELIQKLLGKKYSDMTSEVSKLSDEQKGVIKSVLNKNSFLSTTQIRLLQTVLTNHKTAIASVAFKPDGCHALTGAFDRSAYVWDLNESPIISYELMPSEYWITSFAFSHDGRFALTGLYNGIALLWDLTKTSLSCLELEGHTDGVTSIAVSPNGSSVLTGSADGTARLWDLTQFPVTSQRLIGHKAWVRVVAFSPCATRALTGSHDRTAQLWDLTQSPITSQELSGHTKELTAVAFSPDGRLALTGSFDTTARLWDLTKSPITSIKLTGHTDGIKSAAFSPDSRFALTGSWDKTAKLWDLTKSPITSQELRGHSDFVTSVAFSPNGRSALTVSGDKTVKLWQIEKIDNILSIEDSLLILKLYEDDNNLKDDANARNRLQSIVKAAQKQPLITQLIADCLYRIELHEQACWICTEKYDPESRICMQLPCCKKQICKVCLDKLGGMTYSTEFEGYQFVHSITQKKCPYCNKPGNEMGPIKKFDTNKNVDYREDKHG